ncbi:MAG: lysylphosphatidylglycerol synthase transmembrane domain-containing protein [Gemmatimonadaceae bacterium]
MKFSWRGAIGLALTILLLWWVFKDAHWAEMWAHLRNANVPLVILAVAVGTCMFPLRARRWRPILDSVSPNLPFDPLWRSTAVGMMANNILPARIGELVRAYMLTRLVAVPFSASFASLVVDRAFDAVIVLLLTVAAMFDPRFPAGVQLAGRSTGHIAGTGLVLVVAIGLALYAIVFFPARLIRIYELFVRRVAPRFEERGKAMLKSFAEGLSVLRHPARFAAVVWWTLLHWLVQALAFFIMFKAVGITAPFSAALFVQGVIVIGVSLPSTPGYFGFFEAAAKVSLVMYGVSESLAVAWALTYHILSLIPITVIGLYYLARSGMRLGELQQIQR